MSTPNPRRHAGSSCRRRNAARPKQRKYQLRSLKGDQSQLTAVNRESLLLAAQKPNLFALWRGDHEREIVAEAGAVLRLIMIRNIILACAMWPAAEVRDLNH